MSRRLAHRRLLGIAATAACALALPALGRAGHSPGVADLQAQNARLAQQSRSAVLDLYALDTQLANAQTRLAALRRRETAVKTQRSNLAVELRYARLDERLSQERIASRLRFLYDHGTTSTLELFLGARSLEAAVSELDDIDRLSSVNDDVLHELRTNEVRMTRLRHRLTHEQLSLDVATQQAAVAAASLAQARASRSSFVARLESQQSVNVSTINSLVAQAQAAQIHTQQLPTPIRTPTSLAVATAPAAANGSHTLTVSSTAYSLPGYTASGLHTGWGIIAVDPSVIPLGTHVIIPGYGPAVAADVGTAVIGLDIDIWFPTLAQAQAYGRRTITITVQ